MNSESLRTDVFVDGTGVRRGARVTIAGVALLCDELMVPYGEVFWVSRRKGMLLLFAVRATLAIKGTPKELDRLYDLLTERVDLTELRRRIVRQLGHEVVLFTAGCAAAGTIDGEKVGGLHVAAVTRRALYLLAQDRQLTVSWPARAASRRPAKKADSEERDDYLVIGKPDTSLTIRYLFGEEIGAVLYAASQEPPESGEGRPLELFSRGEVSPPPQAELPPFSLAAGSLQEVAERAAANVPGELQAKVAMRDYFFETHFQELGEIALGPLLLRKSAAGGAYSLEKAIDAMNSGGLQDDTRAAVSTAADRLAEVYAGELDRLAGVRGADISGARSLALGDAGKAFLVERMQEPFDRLWERFGDQVEHEADLRRRIMELEVGHPDQDDSEMHAAAEEWRAAMVRLDRGYEGAWREMVEEIERAWSTDLLPRLALVGQIEKPRFPEWAQMAALAAITILLAAVLLFVLAR
ncbi:MAG: hypothetical protein KJO44_05710 [Gemmatimonadetes bacterium]|nr:hypothetical protein [Gemmatimonadota bacterium]NNK49512.1 hypothetical protein [Gemmatimonadota bacterium]